MDSKRPLGVAPVEEIQRIEADHYAFGRVPVSDTPDAVLYRAQVVEADAKRAEALRLLQQANPLLQIRAAIFRGSFEQSRELLERAEREASRSDSERAELDIEKTRLVGLEGRWEEARALASALLSEPLTPVSRLAVHQIRAMTAYELGDFNAAGEDLLAVEALGTLFPRTPALLHARLIQARIEARTESPRAGLAELAKIWRSLVSDGALGSGEASALLRVETDLRREAGLPHTAWALATLRLETQLGERLYQGLAFVDYYFSLPASARAPHASALDRHARDFARVARLRDEAVGVATTTSGRSIHRAAADPCAGPAPDIATALAARTIFVPGHELVLQLSAPGQAFAAHSLEGKARSLRMLRAPAPLAKEEFFRHAYGPQRYSPERHDPLIWNALSRLKRELGVQGAVVDGNVVFKEHLCVEGGPA